MMAQAHIRARPKVVLSGPPGVGKTTVAAAVGPRLGKPVRDLDAALAASMGGSVASFIEAEGEAAFRVREAEALEATALDTPEVLALGGGTLTTRRSRAAARRLGPVLGLAATPATLQDRLQAKDAPRRPLLDDLSALLERRAATYSAVDARVLADASPEDVANDVAERAAQLTLLEAPVGDAVTRVLIGEGLIEAPAGALAHLEPRRPVIAICDQGVPEAAREARLAPVRALFDTKVIEVPGGEAVKTWAYAGEVLETALASGGGRQSAVLAIGGGATCDLAGLVAHLLGRGAPLVLVPSTLLAQVDASVGGKCAVNMPSGRNLVGAFHAATDVIIDPTLLDSLAPEEYRSGLAELFKMAVIGDRDLFDHLVAAGRADPTSIARAVALKAEIVARDPFEAGERRLLNLGHTLGHALETASGHALRHGEAVAIGLAAVARLSVELGHLGEDEAKQIISALEGLGLPTSADPALLERASAHIGADKKSAAGEAALICILGVANVAVQTLPLMEAQRRLVRHGGHR